MRILNNYNYTYHSLTYYYNTVKNNKFFKPFTWNINYNNITSLLTVSVSLSILSSIQDECLRDRKGGGFVLDSASELWLIILKLTSLNNTFVL